MNGKVDEIFDQLIGCIESYDQNQGSKISELQDYLTSFPQVVKEQFTSSLEDVETRMETVKVDLQEMLAERDKSWEDKLQVKANKAAVATALHRKANKKEVDESFKSLETRVTELAESLKAGSDETTRHSDELNTAVLLKIEDLEKRSLDSSR